MDRFEKAWSATVERNASDHLMRLVRAAYDEIVRNPSNLAALKMALENLISFLCTPPGRTDENCRSVDRFFSLHEEWEGSWKHLPEEIQNIINDIGGTLHDTVSEPNIARNFNSLPEQLLERIQNIDI